MNIDPWLLENLVCPRTKQELEYRGDKFVSPSGDEYPIYHGIPVMILPDLPETYWANQHSYLWATRAPKTPQEQARLFEESERLYPKSRTCPWFQWAKQNMQATESDPVSTDPTEIDGFVAQVVASTSGRLWHCVRGNLKEYPIPEIRFPSTTGKWMLDIGCGWGRWCLAAARKGYQPVGIDSTLWTVMAARRVAHQHGVWIPYVVADCRYLPFRDETFDNANCFSVLAALEKSNARQSLSEIRRILKPGGASLVELSHTNGIRQIYNRMRQRGTPDPRDFGSGRWWTLKEMESVFTELIGPSRLEIDCFFSTNAQGAEAHILPWKYRSVIYASEFFRHLSRVFPWLIHVADSIFIYSTKPPEGSKPVHQTAQEARQTASEVAARG